MGRAAHLPEVVLRHLYRCWFASRIYRHSPKGPDCVHWGRQVHAPSDQCLPPLARHGTAWPASAAVRTARSGCRSHSWCRCVRHSWLMRQSCWTCTRRDRYEIDPRASHQWCHSHSHSHSHARLLAPQALDAFVRTTCWKMDHHNHPRLPPPAAAAAMSAGSCPVAVV